jgi:fructose-1,6-bisphosphatase I
MSPSTKRPSLNDHLHRVSRVPDDLRHLIQHIARAGTYIHQAIRTSDTGLSGGTNQYGEQQVKLDVLSNDIVQEHLRESRLVASFCSEEEKEIVEIDPAAPYSVVFDPLDGSSLVDTNFAVGTIVGIYRGPEIIGRRPREHVAALYVLYGPRTILVYAAGNGVHEFILNEVGEFVLLREYVGISDAAKNFAPGNLGSVATEDAYKAVLDYWISSGRTLRYSGCMVADIHHIFAKGQGIFTYPAGKKYPQGKLRLVFECGPFAYMITQAGGSADTGSGDILDVAITNIDQRVPIIAGSKEEVAAVCKLLGQTAAKKK